jgi:hypothetical protein
MENILPENTIPKKSGLRWFKISILGFLSLMAWSFDWFLINQIISQNQSLPILGWTFLLTAVAIAFTTFFHLVNPAKILWLVYDAVLLVGYIAIMPKNIYVVLGGVIFTALILAFEYRIRSEEKSRQDFSIQKIASASISLIVYGLLLLLGFNVYYNVQTSFDKNPNAYYDKLSQAAGKTVPYFTQGLNVNGLSETDKQELTTTIADQAVNRIENSLQGQQQYIPFVFAIIITAFLWTFSFLLRWFAVVIMWILFEILKGFGFFRLEKVMVEVKKLIV